MKFDKDGFKRLGLPVALLILTTLSGCGEFCVVGFCAGTGLAVSEREYDLMNDEFRLTGKNTYGDVSMVYELQDLTTIDALSFGEEQHAMFEKYGVVNSMQTLSDSALETYRNEYVIPAKHCPASFMNKNLKALMLIGASDAVDQQLRKYKLAFDPEGTSFSVSGHKMKHLSHRYIENGKPLNFTIPEHISIRSNVGSASRHVTYFLVTEIGNSGLSSDLNR